MKVITTSGNEEAPLKSHIPVIRLRPRSAFDGGALTEIWRYRELLYLLTWRDIKIRYQQTVLGITWAVLQPLLTMLIVSVFFGKLAGLSQKTGDIPYPVYVYSGLLPWMFFSNAVTTSGNSLISNTNLITKIYFPRLIIPLAAVAANIVDLLLATIVLLGLMVFHGSTFHLTIIWAPLVVLSTILAATGVGALLSALMVRFRDFRYVVPFMLQIWFLVTPVIYPSTIVPSSWQWLLAMNPVSGLVQGFRSAFLGEPIDLRHLSLSCSAALAIFLTGAIYFRSVERRFADII